MNTALERLDRLTRALLPLAADPEGVDRLYDLLGEFCHVLRDRLNNVKLSIYLAQRPGAGPAALEEVARQCRDLEQCVERLQAIGRPLRLTRVAVPLGAVLDEHRAAWVEALAARGRPLYWSPPRDEAPTLLDPAVLGDGLDDLVAWRAKAGPEGAPVRLAWHGAGGEVRLTWEEPEGEDSEPPAERGPRLALALLARIASAHGGRVELAEGDGFRFELILPSRVEPRAEAPAPPRAVLATLASPRVR
jgi:signal transduction histidine kinase